MTAPDAGGGEQKRRAVLRLGGAAGEHAVQITVPPEEATLLDLLPAAREISGSTTEMALARERAAGREISCRAGCGACCRQLVAITFVEAEALARLVAAMPPERAGVIRERFASAIKRLEDSGLLDPAEPPGDRALISKDHPSVAFLKTAQRFFGLGIACPFLENESCSIHPDRPLVCREHHVTTPAERCTKSYEAEIDRVEPPFRMGEALARTIPNFVPLEVAMIPLVLSLEWSAAHGAELDVQSDGKALLNSMIGNMRGR